MLQHEEKDEKLQRKQEWDRTKNMDEKWEDKIGGWKRVYVRVYLHKLTVTFSELLYKSIKNTQYQRSHTHTLHTSYTHIHYGSVPFPERWIIVPLHSDKQREACRYSQTGSRVDRVAGRQMAVNTCTKRMKSLSLKLQMRPIQNIKC